MVILNCLGLREPQITKKVCLTLEHLGIRLIRSQRTIRGACHGHGTTETLSLSALESHANALAVQLDKGQCWCLIL
jgi:hypothetical protein